MERTLNGLVLEQPDIVKLELEATDGTGAIRELHAALQDAGAIVDHKQFLSDLLKRHAIGGVCLNSEIALPHARTAAVNRFICAVGRSERGIVFDAPHPAVRLVILTGVPVGAVTDHLQWLARLARALRERTVRGGLINARTPSEFVQIWESHLGADR